MRVALPLATLACATAFVSIAACGGRVDDGNGTSGTSGAGGPSQRPSPVPAPGATDPAAPRPGASGLYVPDDKQCARGSADSASVVLRPRDSLEDVAVVELSVAQECTGLGGEYLLARDLHSSRRFWLGGHGCGSTKLLYGLATTFGVVRYMNTSSVLTIPAGVCVSFPGEDADEAITTATKIRAVASFATQSEAEAFARSVAR